MDRNKEFQINQVEETVKNVILTESRAVSRQVDVVLFLSKGGATPELVRLAKICRERHAATIAVSEKGGSSLTETCDLWLKVKVDRF